MCKQREWRLGRILEAQFHVYLLPEEKKWPVSGRCSQLQLLVATTYAVQTKISFPVLWQLAVQFPSPTNLGLDSRNKSRHCVFNFRATTQLNQIHWIEYLAFLRWATIPTRIPIHRIAFHSSVQCSEFRIQKCTKNHTDLWELSQWHSHTLNWNSNRVQIQKWLVFYVSVQPRATTLLKSCNFLLAGCWFTSMVGKQFQEFLLLQDSVYRYKIHLSTRLVLSKTIFVFLQLTLTSNLTIIWSIILVSFLTKCKWNIFQFNSNNIDSTQYWHLYRNE